MSKHGADCEFCESGRRFDRRMRWYWPGFIAVCVTLAILAWACNANAGYKRPVRDVTYAIEISSHYKHARARRYAGFIKQIADKKSIDPLSVISIITFESHWNPNIRNGSGATGLMQVLARYYKGDPNDLRNPAINVDEGTNIILGFRDVCRSRLKRSAKFREWLHGYGGWGKLKKGSKYAWLCGWKFRRKGKRWIPIRPEMTKSARKYINRTLRHRLWLICRLNKRYYKGRRRCRAVT